MIYQCYFKADQTAKLFNTPAYTPFGLEPDVNSNLFLNCEELRDPQVRLALTEYACFLWFYRNQDKLPGCIGFTSYRQLDKSKIILDSLPMVESSTVVSWGVSEFFDAAGMPIPMSLQAELAHPGINSYINQSLSFFNHPIPKSWYLDNICILGNYWLMTKDNFIDFMNFSWPLVKKSLEDFRKKSHVYFRSEMNFGCSSSKAVGYYMERLFIVWMMIKNLKISSVCEVKKMRSPVMIYV